MSKLTAEVLRDLLEEVLKVKKFDNSIEIKVTGIEITGLTMDTVNKEMVEVIRDSATYLENAEVTYETPIHLSYEKVARIRLTANT